MYTKILVPVDGSESSDRALDKAIKLGNQFGSEIYVLTVIHDAYIMRSTSTTAHYGVVANQAANQEIIKATKKILSDAEEKFKDYKFPHFSNSVVGDASQEILNYVQKHDIPLIVMGNRGMGAFSRTILGSVSNKVVNASPVSVLVVKD